MTVVLADRAHPLRGRLESMVQAQFLAEYGARVPRFSELLIASLDDAGMPQAVAGLRFADEGLFSEVYLDGPIERVVAEALGRPVQRDRIVEFSSLAAPRPGAAMPLIGAGIRFCRSAGADFGLFTATVRLRVLLRRTRLTTFDLGPARPERVRNSVTWGTYYLRDPRVLVATADALPPMWAMEAPYSEDARCHA